MHSFRLDQRLQALVIRTEQRQNSGQCLDMISADGPPAETADAMRWPIAHPTVQGVIESLSFQIGDRRVLRERQFPS